MSRAVSIAFWTYVTPILATRAMRVGLLLFVSAASTFVALFLSRVLSERFMVETLEASRHFLIMLGLPVAGAVMSELPLRDGITHRTLLYPLLGPVPRSTFALVRTVVTAAVLAAGLVLLLLLVRLLLRDGLGFLPREALAVTLGALAYTGVFGALHVVNRRGLITGLVALFFFDIPLGTVPFAIRNLSLSYHVGVIAGQRDDMALPIQLASPDASVAFSAAVLIAVAALSIAATAWLFRRMDLGDVC